MCVCGGGGSPQYHTAVNSFVEVVVGELHSFVEVELPST